MKTIEILTLIMGFIPYVILIVGIFKKEVKQSFATWALWLALDIIVLFGILIQHGNAILFVIFTFGTSLVALSLLLQHQFSWGKLENFVMFLVVICVIIFLFGTPYISVIATTVALNIAGIPQLVGTFKNPKATSTKAYIFLSVASLLSVVGAETWSVKDVLPQISSMFFCMTVTILSLRKSPQP